MVALVLAFNPGDHRSPLPLSGVVVDAHIDPGMRISPRGDVGIPPYTRTIMFLCFNLNLNLNLRRLRRTFPILRLKKSILGVFILHIIYHCVGGAHSSPTAAAIHLNMLPMDHIPSKYDLLNIPFYDTLEKIDRGKIILRGTDEFGNKVYTLSRQFEPKIILSVITDMWSILGNKPNDLLLVDTLPCVNTLMKIGGFSSRRLKWVKFGRPIVAKGTIDTYPNLVNVVKKTKEMLQ